MTVIGHYRMMTIIHNFFIIGQNKNNLIKGVLIMSKDKKTKEN